jgi:tetratricopeptide (TPR) repeat protein
MHFRREFSPVFLALLLLANTFFSLSAWAAGPLSAVGAQIGQSNNSKGAFVTLREAVKKGEVAFSIHGDGVTTSSVQLTINNKTGNPLRLVIPVNESFRSNSGNVQTMMVTKDTIVSVGANAQIQVAVDTICASLKTMKPPPADGVSFVIGDYPDKGTWSKLSKIMAAAADLDKNAGFDSIALDKKRRQHTIAQYAVWMALGRQSGGPDDQLTKESIQSDFLKELSEQVKNNPRIRQDLEEHHQLGAGGDIVLDKKQKAGLGARVEAIFNATDLTCRRSEEANLPGICGLPDDSNWSNLNQVGLRAFGKGDYVEAQELLEAAETEAEKFPGKDARLANSLNNLGRCLLEEGLTADAEPKLKRALVLFTAINGDDSVEGADVLENLATLFSVKNDLATAEQNFKRALAIRQKKLGADHIEVADTLNELGGVFISEKKFDEAESVLKNSLAIRYKAKGGDSPEVAAVNTNLANLYCQTGKYAQAEKLSMRALSIDQKALGADNPFLATILDVLSQAYKAQRKDSEAQTCIATAAAMRKKVLGDNTSRIASLPANYEAQTRLLSFVNDKDRMEASVKEIQGSTDPKLLKAVEVDQKAKANRAVQDKWALVVGISKYQDSSINLKYAAKDAKDFYDYLVNEAHFQPDHIRLLLDEKATRVNILSSLGDKFLPHAAGPNDLVVFYFSGHGSPSAADSAGANYLIAHDTDKNSLFATGIKVQEFTDMIKQRVHSDRMILAMDACHSGAAEPGAKGIFRVSNFSVDEIAQGSGQYVVCSSQPSQVSWESKKYPNGVFTHCLLEGLRKDGDKTKLGDACTYMQDKVQREVLNDRGEMQTPVVCAHWEGEGVMLAVKPANPGPGLADDEFTVKAPVVKPIANVASKGIVVPAKSAVKKSVPAAGAAKPPVKKP